MATVGLERHIWWPRLRARTKESLWAIALLMPFLIGLVLFTIGPLLAAIGISFTNWSLISAPTWAGLGNFKQLFSDPVFLEAWKNTAYYTLVAVPGAIVLGLGLALLLNQKIRGAGVFRVLFFLPMTVGIVASGLLWAWMFTPQYGIVNYVLHFFGIGPIPWLTSSSTAMLAVICVGVWKTLGFNIIIFLAGLQTIPSELYEAAAIDGAGEFRKLRNITLPMLSPTLFFATLIGLIFSFQVFEQTYVMTQGGPGNSTLTIIYYIYQEGFSYLRMGYASAASVTFILVVAILTGVMMHFQDRWVHYEN